MSIPLLRALTATTFDCTRCGSSDVHPSPGAFGPLIGFLRLMRYGCRGCRRAFWIRADAGARRVAPAPRPAEAGAPRARTPPAALDFEVAPATAEKVDLAPLDAEFEKIRIGGAKGGESRTRGEKKRRP